MDPNAVSQVTSSSPSLIAALVAVSIAMTKLLEIAITALTKRYGKASEAQQVEIQLDPELTSKISDMSDKIGSMYSVMGRTDNDGTPMVYSSRSGMEAVRDIAVIIRNVSQTQERLAVVMERLEQKFSAHDASDNLVQTQINSTLERMLKAFDEHDRRVAESIAAQNEILRLVHKNNDAIIQHMSERD